MAKDIELDRRSHTDALHLPLHKDQQRRAGAGCGPRHQRCELRGVEAPSHRLSFDVCRFGYAGDGSTSGLDPLQPVTNGRFAEVI
jgi:hypothetical protein